LLYVPAGPGSGYLVISDVTNDALQYLTPSNIIRVLRRQTFALNATEVGSLLYATAPHAARAAPGAGKSVYLQDSEDSAELKFVHDPNKVRRAAYHGLQRRGPVAVGLSGAHIKFFIIGDPLIVD
jgi:hypothetical protein